MHIEPKHIQFYESVGDVLAVVTNGDRELALILSLSGEGDKWISTLQFELSEDKNTMTDVTSRGNRVAFVRCDGAMPK